MAPPATAESPLVAPPDTKVEVLVILNLFSFFFFFFCFLSNQVIFLSFCRNGLIFFFFFFEHSRTV